MRRLLAFVAAFSAILLIGGCGGGGKPPAPTNVAVAPHDSSAIVTWDVNSGVDYWVWVAPGSTITLEGCRQLVACQIHRNVTSPFLVLNLVNGTQYAAIVNASNGGGPVGASSPPIAFVPNAVGKVWTVGTPLASSLRGVNYTGAAAITSATFIAVGAGGTLYSSANATTWTALTSNVATNLNDVRFGNSRFVVVGDAGTVLVSTDGVTWTASTPFTTNSLSSLVVGTQFVVVGSGGAIFTSADGITWAAAASGTTNDLNAVTFSTGIVASLLDVGYIAVGAAGTNLTSF